MSLEVTTAPNKAGKKEVEVLIFEGTIKGDSGFRKEVAPNVMSQREEDRRTTVGTIYIPSVSFRWDESGNQIPIRYIPNISEIDITKQKAMGHTAETDRNGAYIHSSIKILMLNGLMVLRNEGDVAKFKFMQNAAFNESAPNRPEYDATKKFYKIIEPIKDEEFFNDTLILRSEATSYVTSLIKKGANGSHDYKVEKIDAILSMFGIYGGDTPSQKLTVLFALAEQDSVNFLSKVKSLDDLVITLIIHAEELKVIRIAKNLVEFTESKKIIANFEGENLSKDNKVKQLAELLKTADYASKYQELQAAVELKEKQSLEN